MCTLYCLMINLEGHTTKLKRPILRHYPSRFLYKLRENTERNLCQESEAYQRELNPESLSMYE
jgi:hypothetical protein